MRFLIDIDGTVLTQQQPGEYELAKPTTLIVPDILGNDLAIKSITLVNKLFNEGNEITFYTSRNYKYMQMTYAQLKELGFKFHNIEFNKPHGDRILDDRAIPFVVVR